jgi:predicted dehydrogenase
VSESVVLRVLVHGGETPAMAPLLAALAANGGLDVTSRATAEPLRPAGAHVVLAAGDRPPDDEELRTLADHVQAGGGLVVLGAAAAAWGRRAESSILAGWRTDEIGPPTELRLRPEARGPLAVRLDPEILLRDRLVLGGPPPEGTEVLATVPWRYGELAAAFRRRLGAGRLVHLTLGLAPEALADVSFQRLVHRAVRAAAGLDSGPPVGVGLYGYGAIGREHASSAEAVEGLELRGICDRSRHRLADAASRFSVATHPEARDLLADPAIDLVVVGVPPALHAEAALECLRAGKHVVSEKPFTLRAAEADRVIAAAADAGRTVTVYQSRRWDPDFVALRRAVQSGAVGDPFYLEAFIGGYGHPCSYWHSHEPVSGGTIFDWGSHYFDWMLQLMPGRVVSVAAMAHKRVWYDVTNADQVRVDLTLEGGRQATFLQSDVAAALKPKWYLVGTEGAAVGDWRLEAVRARAWTGDLVEERLQPSESPARVSLHRPDGQGGVHVTELALSPRAAQGFYRNLADHLLLGEPLAVPATDARRSVAVMEAATRSVAGGGRPVELLA